MQNYQNIKDVDAAFLNFLNSRDSKLYSYIQEFRASPDNCLSSSQIIEISEVLEEFIAYKFGIKFSPANIEYPLELYNLRKSFIHRYILKQYDDKNFDEKSAKEEFFEFSKLDENSLDEIDRFYVFNLEKFETNSREHNILCNYAYYRMRYGRASPFFSKPEAQDFDNLLNIKADVFDIRHSKYHPILEAKYCINCHKTSKDSCRTGIKNQDFGYKKNPLGNELKGCPLGVKISEMNYLFGKNKPIAALAIILIDNPFVALTGARICNDCSKSCIFQKQQPVDVPSIESEILKEVLKLEYGPEIYYLLLMWNPLSKIEKKEKRIGNVLVVGSGPAGMLLSYYLLMEGISVFMIEGQKIEPLPAKYKDLTIKDYKIISEIYNQIMPNGFGGVAEYGITDRWNKENLVLLRLFLEKFENFHLIGSVRFGSSITLSDAIDMGFDHIALCCGSGYPKIPFMENIHATGVRSANDFLMASGLGMIKDFSSSTKFDISLPAYVVGLGLTGVDAAVELVKYYPIYCKKIKKLAQDSRGKLHENKKLEKIINHAKLFEEEENLAKLENRKPDLDSIVKSLGGVHIIYRNNINNSPAYRLNSEELIYLINHKIEVIDNHLLHEIETDNEGNLSSIIIKNGDDLIKREAGALLFATGTEGLRIEDFAQGNRNKISVFGDMDPKYHGSVVKALASVKDNYKEIINQPFSGVNLENFGKLFDSRIKEINFLNNKFFELKIHSPYLAKKAISGQFFKLQNFHQNIDNIDGKSSIKSFKPIALSASRCFDEDITFYVEIKGAGTLALSKMKAGDKISLMGPNAASFEIYKNSNIMIITEGIYLYTIFDYLRELKKQGNNIILCSLLSSQDDLFFENELKEASNSFNLFSEFESLNDFVSKNLAGARNIQILGSGNFIKDISGVINSDIIPTKAVYNSPMQCMMGGVCGQCFLKVSDGVETRLRFMCKQQNQPLNSDSAKALIARLKQNKLQEDLIFLEI